MINDLVNTGLQPAVNAKASASPAEKAPVKDDAKPATTESALTPDTETLNQAVSKLNDYVQNIRRTLSFSISETTGHTIIEVYDAETKELIRQIPPEKTVLLAENLSESAITGVFVKERA